MIIDMTQITNYLISIVRWILYIVIYFIIVGFVTSPDFQPFFQKFKKNNNFESNELMNDESNAVDEHENNFVSFFDNNNTSFKFSLLNDENSEQ
eukprot:TRINITY_DN10793_c0_g1_i1.p1 TRINITY_DN10793_c0_g1~~TRINITY_DN10793_c0_g1_i1.p1  ORF type:complete len:94 (+),score=24.53 TRINITY_DN10793_c0_g1_i1:58-339(+)